MIISPYKITRRTEYSKLRLFNLKTNEDITKENRDLFEELLDNYEKQVSDPKKYFRINAAVLSNISTTAKETKYLFVPEETMKISKSTFSNAKFVCVSLPESLQTINDYAFYNCNRLEDLYIPDSVNSIWFGAFEGCKNLKHIRLSNSLSQISGRSFYDCISLSNISFPDSITITGNYVFSGCKNLKNVKLSKNLEELGDATFSGCEKLSHIDLPTSLQKIGKDCFLHCKSLDEVTIPDNVKDVGPRAFSNCTLLSSVKLPKNLEKLETELFAECANLKDIILPDSISTFGSHIFKGTTKLKNINIPKNLSSVGVSPFAYSSLESLTFDYDLETLDIKNSDLLGCSDIYKLVIDNKVRKIEFNAFRSCGYQIREIDYLGTKEQFEIFKENNSTLIDICLRNLERINFMKH